LSGLARVAGAEVLSGAASRVKASRALSHALNGLSAAAGVLGVFIAALTPLRLAVSLVVLLSCCWLAVSGYEPPPDLALAFFGVAFTVRYGFLFASFAPNGIAARLTARYGSMNGFSIYEAATALLMFVQRLAFVWVLVASYGEASGSIGSALMSLGCFLVALGAVMSVWATQTAGLPAYYYADLFHGTTANVLTKSGPYATFKNPMYGVGRFTAYGFALIAVSPVGLIIAALDQLALYAFNELVEQPYVRSAERSAHYAGRSSASAVVAAPYAAQAAEAEAAPSLR
jgi:protein-S-isoprenylcysteine O-methyltransferase Ste14